MQECICIFILNLMLRSLRPNCSKNEIFLGRFSNHVIKSHSFASRSFCGDKIECKLHFLASFQEIDAASNIQATEQQQQTTFTNPMRAKSNAVLLGHWIIKKKYIVGCVTTSLIIAFQSLIGYYVLMETLFRFPVCVTDFGSSAHNFPPLCGFIPFHVRPFHVGPIYAGQFISGHFMPVPFHFHPISCPTVQIHACPIFMSIPFHAHQS